MNLSAFQSKTIYVVIFALILNAITSTGAFAAANSGSQSVLLCTSQGYQWVEVESDSVGTQQPSQHCKLCLFPPSDDAFDKYLTSHPYNDVTLEESKLKQAATTTVVLSTFAYFLAQGRAPPIRVFS
ncbi:hypothetical protein NBRC116583_05730 [Arenicella sp. 4NH20-0111]|uniref:hypothetical protein n=1 Tax=Arenicella sp. 4NH20-0111 TaxID=3127648 RepID=UPI0031048547